MMLWCERERQSVVCGCLWFLRGCAHSKSDVLEAGGAHTSHTVGAWSGGGGLHITKRFRFIHYHYYSADPSTTKRKKFYRYCEHNGREYGPPLRNPEFEVGRYLSLSLHTLHIVPPYTTHTQYCPLSFTTLSQSALFSLELF
jgi:hypothetical protein